jgi:SAM-dependent methyltransferase
MFAPEKLDPTVEFLAELANGGRVLEFAIGTGRVAVPLHRQGVDVTGIELSPHMVDQLRHKATSDEIPVAIGDMTTTCIPGSFSLVYLVWNSLSNLLTMNDQAECFRNAARHLAVGGRFAIDLWIPAPSPDGRPVLAEWSDSHVCIDTYDTTSQICRSHHFFRESDGRFRFDAGDFRYAWPEECDQFAWGAGLELESRYGDWNRSPFSAASTRHVSIWRKPNQDGVQAR